MNHKFYIQQFDLSFLQVSESVYLNYLKKSRSFSTLEHSIDYQFVYGIPNFEIVTVLHFLTIHHSWL